MGSEQPSSPASDDSLFYPQPGHELNPADELANQGRLAFEGGEDDTIATTKYGDDLPSTGPSNPRNQNPVPGPNPKPYDQPQDSNPETSDPDLEDKKFSNPHLDSGSHEGVNPGPGPPHTTAGPSHQPGGHHGREHATDHGTNSVSGQSHSEQQARPPGRRNPPPSQGKSWKYETTKRGVKKTLCEYIYDEGGRLVAEGGYESNMIRYYLDNHTLYIGRDVKDCGLTLWIQRAPRTADYRGGAAGRLCLYKECYVSKDRSIKPGDVRVAFDDSYARTPEHDPQANAGYVHLECLEKHMTEDLREMYAALNFKVEERGPHPNDPLHRNPTIFSTMQEILYVEKYLEQCMQEFKEDSKEDSNDRPVRNRFYSSPLSTGIEKQRKGQYDVVRDFQRKILELGGSEGWYRWNTKVEKLYVEAGGPAQTVNPIQSQPPRIEPSTTSTRPDPTRRQPPRINSPTIGTRPDPTRGQPQEADSNPNDFDVEDYPPGTNQEPDRNDDTIPPDPYGGGGESDTSARGVRQDQPTSTKRPLSKPPKKTQRKIKGKKIEPPFKGRGKIKQRMLIDNEGGEVWEKFEDPFSNPASETEPVKRTRKPRNENQQVRESTAGAQDVKRKNRDDDDEDENGRDDVEDENGDRGYRSGQKRTRGVESQGRKSKRGRPRKR